VIKASTSGSRSSTMEEHPLPRHRRPVYERRRHDSKEIMPDYLHLSKEGYERWAKAIDGPVKEMMGQ
jgi:lysophospholipase L1-like esterase